MRVAYICTDPGIPVFGFKGSSVHLQEVLRALRKQGASIDLFAVNVTGQPPPGLEGVRVHLLPPIPKGEASEREKGALAANEHVQDILRRSGTFDLIYERFSLWSYAAMEHAFESGMPGLLEVNAPLIEEQARHRVLVHRDLAEHAARRAFCAATRLLAVSPAVASWLESFSGTSERISIIPNGVDTRRFQPGRKPLFSRTPESFTLGFVGTLKPWHDLDTLLSAFEILQLRYPHVRLLVIGDGPRYPYLKESLVARGLLSACHLAGAVASAEVPAWLTSMDVALALYPRLEQFYFSPLKLFEYMAAGLPVIATGIGQLADFVQNGVNGFLCPPGNVAAAVNALECLRNEPDLRRAMGQSGRAFVCRHHTWDAVASRILELSGVRQRCFTGIAEG